MQSTEFLSSDVDPTGLYLHFTVPFDHNFVRSLTVVTVSGISCWKYLQRQKIRVNSSFLVKNLTFWCLPGVLLNYFEERSLSN